MAGLIWVNPRFVHLDKSTTLEEASRTTLWVAPPQFGETRTGTLSIFREGGIRQQACHVF